MLEVNTTAQFRLDLCLCHTGGCQLELLQAAVDILRIPGPLTPEPVGHHLSGRYGGFRVYHVLPDWLLIYCKEGKALYLTRTGKHSVLFGG